MMTSILPPGDGTSSVKYEAINSCMDVIRLRYQSESPDMPTGQFRLVKGEYFVTENNKQVADSGSLHAARRAFLRKCAIDER